MRSAFLAICCLSVLSGCSGKSTSEHVSSQWHFHTTPDKWADTRSFHTPFNEKWSDRIVIQRTQFAQVNNKKVFSPNNAYWYSVAKPDFSKPWPHNLQIDIYNERDYLITLQLLDIAHYAIHTKWINEKLVYVRVWLGRVLGIDLIFDVETEQIIYKENINCGSIAFLQWQQARKEE